MHMGCRGISHYLRQMFILILDLLQLETASLLSFQCQPKSHIFKHIWASYPIIPLAELQKLFFLNYTIFSKVQRVFRVQPFPIAAHSPPSMQLYQNNTSVKGTEGLDCLG